MVLKRHTVLNIINKYNNCGRQVEPAILISRLLLGMRRMYVGAFVWTSTKNEWNVRNLITSV